MEETKVLKKALLAGGGVLTRYFGLVNYKLKGRANLLTEADLRSQREIVSVIKKAFPDHGILAEEGALSRTLTPVPERKARGPLWIIDPLDGTTNYAHTFPAAAVSIGFISGGRTMAGGVFDPFRKEIFLAGRGRGSFLNGRRIKVSRVPKLSRALLVTGFPYDRAEKADFYCSIFSRFMLIAHDIRRMGAASLDLAWLAAGRTDGYWEFGLKPWDVAAGSLLVEEAGGKVGDFSGHTWKETEDYGRQILATNGKIHSEMLKIIGEKLR